MSETRVRQHPTLGILVCSDGHVMVPAVHNRKAHWTCGHKDNKGYLIAKVNNRAYKVHRLVAETFIPNPENLPTVDHIDRSKDNNSVKNLRWASYKTQNDNVDKVDAARNSYGVRECDDPHAYWRKYSKERRDRLRSQRSNSV